MSEQLFTIGHSNHPLDGFLSLLRQHGVEALADIRRFPVQGSILISAGGTWHRNLRRPGSNTTVSSRLEVVVARAVMIPRTSAFRTIRFGIMPITCCPRNFSRASRSCGTLPKARRRQSRVPKGYSGNVIDGWSATTCWRTGLPSCTSCLLANCDRTS
jgi:hypothetical protein